MPKIENLVGKYKKEGYRLTQLEEGRLCLIMGKRKSPTPKKTKEFLLGKGFAGKDVAYISSLYPKSCNAVSTGSYTFYEFDYKGANYTLEVVNDADAEIKKV